MSSNKHFQVEDKDMTKQENDDPEWNPRIQFGEIASQINQLLDKGKTLIGELEAKAAMSEREARLIKRGTIEVKQRGKDFIATFDPEARTVKINGRTVPSKPSQIMAVDDNPYSAVASLAGAIRKAEVLG